MKPILLLFILAFSAQSFAFDATWEGDCGMQTAPRTPKEGPRIFNVTHVKLNAGESYTIFKDGTKTYSVDFLADDAGQPSYGIIVALVDKTKGRKVSEATAFSHDLAALENTMIGLYSPDLKPTAFCGKRQ